MKIKLTIGFLVILLLSSCSDIHNCNLSDITIDTTKCNQYVICDPIMYEENGTIYYLPCEIHNNYSDIKFCIPNLLQQTCETTNMTYKLYCGQEEEGYVYCDRW